MNPITIIGISPLLVFLVSALVLVVGLLFKSDNIVKASFYINILNVFYKAFITFMFTHNGNFLTYQSTFVNYLNESSFTMLFWIFIVIMAIISLIGLTIWYQLNQLPLYYSKLNSGFMLVSFLVYTGSFIIAIHDLNQEKKQSNQAIYKISKVNKTKLLKSDSTVEYQKSETITAAPDTKKGQNTNYRSLTPMPQANGNNSPELVLDAAEMIKQNQPL